MMVPSGPGDDFGRLAMYLNYQTDLSAVTLKCVYAGSVSQLEDVMVELLGDLGSIYS